MNYETICILGGTGFVGQHLANRLTRHGCKVRVLTRRREDGRPRGLGPDVRVKRGKLPHPFPFVVK